MWSFGTGVLFTLEDDDNVVRFDSKPIYAYYIQENAKGIVDEVSSMEKMTVRKAFDKFGRDAFKDEAEKLEKDMEQKIEILHCVLPRKESERIGFGAKSHPFASIYVWAEKQMIVMESGYKEFPFVVPRWMKLSDEIYGRSPSMKALPDIKMLNAVMKTTIRGAQKIVDPPLMVPDDGVLGRVNSTPGGLNTYRAGTDDRIFPLATGGNPGIGVDIMEDIRSRIKQHYFVDQFQLREGPQMTATEVNARVEMQLRLLGPVLGRLHFEFLQPLVGRVLSIMQRKKLLPENPPAELTQGSLDIEVFFTSQIAKAQRSSEANNLLEFLASAQPIVEFDPKAADIIDIDKTIRKVAILKGVPEDIFRDEDEIEELREQRAQAEQQQAAAEQEMIGAEMLSKTAGPAKELGLIPGA